MLNGGKGARGLVAVDLLSAFPEHGIFRVMHGWHDKSSVRSHLRLAVLQLMHAFGGRILSWKMQMHL